MSTPELSRRSALTGVAVALAAAGCDLTTAETPREGASPRASRTTATTPSDDPDAALVEVVRAEIGAALGLVSAAVSRPALTGELAGWRRLHRLHLEAVPGEPSANARPPISGSAAAIRGRIRGRETRLQQSLADAAVSAESGPLAALLASMSAAVAQRLALQDGSA